MSRRKLEKIYDSLYDRAQAILDKYNPCDIRKDKTGHVTCTCTRSDSDYCGRTKKQQKQLCCYGCQFLTKNGCRVRCLMCKLHLCHTIPYSHPARKALDKLQEEAWEYTGFLQIRRSKRFALDHALDHLDGRGKLWGL
jgi:hypothetical protein